MNFFFLYVLMLLCYDEQYDQRKFAVQSDEMLIRLDC